MCWAHQLCTKRGFPDPTPPCRPSRLQSMSDLHSVHSGGLVFGARSRERFKAFNQRGRKFVEKGGCSRQEMGLQEAFCGHLCRQAQCSQALEAAQHTLAPLRTNMCAHTWCMFTHLSVCTCAQRACVHVTNALSHIPTSLHAHT